MRDITLGDTIDLKFTTTEPDTGAPATLSGTPVVSAYVGNSTTQITAGITLSADFDGVTGLNNVRVVASSGNGYTDASDVALIITTGTVDSVSAVGYKVGEFTIGRAASHVRLGAPAGASVSADILAIDNLVDDLESRIGTPSNLGGGATISANLSDIEAQTDDIGAAGAGLTALATAANLATVDGIVDDITQMIGHKTTIATLASQTSFTLTAGSADDNAYNGWGAFVVDQSSAVQIALGVVSDYTGSTKTVTLREDPAIFTMATGDHIILLPGKLTDGVNVTQIEGVDATDQLDAHAAAGLDAAGVRAAVGLASANLDTQLSGIQSDTNDIQTRIPAALVSGRIDASVGAMAANVMTAAAAASDLTTELQSGLATAANLATVAGYLDTEIAAILADTNELQTDWANGGRLDLILDARASQASVDTIDGNVDAILLDTGTDGVVVATASKTGYALSAAGVDAIWDEAQSGHATAGTFGVYLDSAVSGVSTGGVSAAEIADAVWDEALAGHAGAGSAGEALTDAAAGGGLDAAGVRAAVGLASANLDTQLAAIDTVVDAVLVDTAEIGAAGAGLTALATQASVNTIDDLLDTEVAAIKAKTDQLTFTNTGLVDATVKRVGNMSGDLAAGGTGGQGFGA
jgi:hypothetical protein